MILEVPPNPAHHTTPQIEQTQLWICPNSPQNPRSVQAQSFITPLGDGPNTGTRQCRSGNANPAMPVQRCRSAGADPAVSIQWCQSSSVNLAVLIWQCQFGGTDPVVPIWRSQSDTVVPERI